MAPDLSPEEISAISAEVRALAAERNAVILAHNYQLPEIQDVADHMGDSLGLSRQAAATDAEVIAFCGVHFMAETASILSPEKTVLIPDLDAGCSLADSIDADQLRAWKAEHPGAQVVMYVNTSAEVKAETDYCCTSSNAVQVVEHIWAEHGPETEILFGPDMWLGAFVERETGLRDDPERRSRFHVWDGECHVHAGIRPEDIERTRAENPEAEFLIHPECGCSTQAMEYVASGDIEAEGVHMLSTSGMLKHVEENPDGSFIVATENGMLYPLQQAAPRATLIEANRMAFCKYMKMITLPKLRDSPAGDEVRGQRPEGDRGTSADSDRAHGRDRLASRPLMAHLKSVPDPESKASAGATSLAELERYATVLRINCVRMLAVAKSGHLDSSLSAADIVAALYFSELRHDPRQPRVARARPLRPLQGPRGADPVRGAGRARLLPAPGPDGAAQDRLPPPGPPGHEPDSRRRGLDRLARPGPLDVRRDLPRAAPRRPRRARPRSSASSPTATARRARPGRAPRPPPTSRSPT